MHNDKTENKNPTHTRGIIISLKINQIIFLILAVSEMFKEFIADLRKSWFTVSQKLVSAINNKIKIKPCFTPPFLSYRDLLPF
jgi:hypothetical protein